MTDFYRQRLQHFGWTWLERKRVRFHKPARGKERMATRLARAHARRMVARDIAQD